MQTKNPFFDDFAKMMTGGLGIATGLKQEFENNFKSMTESALTQIGVPLRGEFESVLAMIEQMSRKITELEERIRQLENKPTEEEAE